MKYKIEPDVLADIAGRVAAEARDSGALVTDAHELLSRPTRT